MTVYPGRLRYGVLSLLAACPLLQMVSAGTATMGVVPKPPKLPKNREMKSASKPGLNSEMKWVGFGAHKSLDFMDFLDGNAKQNIENFDRLSVGLNVTIEGFFSFVNKIVEAKVTGNEELEDELKTESEEEGEPGLLTKPQLGQLFGGVNNTAVDYILDTVGMDVMDLHDAFNTVDILLVLMYISSHFEPLGVKLSVLDVVEAFCDSDNDFSVDPWAENVAEKFDRPLYKVLELQDQLHGKMDDVVDYVVEIFRLDTCEVLGMSKEKEESASMGRSGGLRGSSRSGSGGYSSAW